MRAGLLSQRITVQRPVETQDSTGDPVVAWTDVATVWGSIEPARASEALRSGQIVAEMGAKVMLRYAPVIGALDEKWRLVHGGVFYNISSVTNVAMANRQFEVMCQSGKNLG